MSKMSLRSLSPTGLAGLVGAKLGRLEDLAARGRNAYRVWTLPGPKQREVHEPIRSLKRVQRCLLRRLLPKFPVHPAAGHVSGKGVQWTLKQHVGGGYLVHRDIKDFFPSVDPDRVRRTFSAFVPVETARLLTALVTNGEALPQGAPTSVAVGDLVLFPLDRRIGGLAQKENITYVRYVDDLTLTGSGWLVDRWADVIDDWILDAGWALNQKGGEYGPGQRHEVLNAVVNEKTNVSKRYFRRIRSYLRLVAGGRRTLSPAEFESLSSKVFWILRLNSGRASALVPLLEEAQAQLRSAA